MIRLLAACGLALLLIAGAPAQTASAQTAGDGALALDAVAYSPEGHLAVAGRADPGAGVQVFVDDRQVAETQAGDDGRWAVKSLRQTPAGVYTLRVDEVQGEGNVVAQLSMPLRRNENRAPAPQTAELPRAPGETPRLIQPAQLTVPAPVRPARPLLLSPEPTAAPVVLPATPAGRVIQLTVSKSRLVRLPSDVRDVLVGNPQIADVVVRAPNVVYVLGKAPGETNVIFLDANGREVQNLDVKVDFDVDSLRGVLKEAVPNESITVIATNQSILLQGAATNAAANDNIRQIARQYVTNDNQIVNMMKLGSEQQVLLKVRVAEVTRQVVKQLGSQVGLAGANAAGSAGGPAGAGDVALNIGRALVNPTAFGTFAGQLAIAGIGQLTLTLEALEQSGLVKILAEPNLTAISGETASFLAGGEFPVPVPQDATTITILFKQFGVRVNFTPVVISPGVINLKVGTEVSQLTDAGAVTLGAFRIPALSVRRADTTVDLPSGGSLVIAGLLQNNLTNNFEGIPGIKDVPILGALFRSAKFQRDETELVITVTPILVKSVESAQLALPSDGFGPANDMGMYLFEKLYARYRPDTPRPAGTIRGPVGFILE